MSHGLLDRPGDEPAPDEEAAIALMKAREVPRLDQIDGRLVTSSRRSRSYVAAGDEKSLRIERKVQDRILDERRAVMGLIGRHG